MSQIHVCLVSDQTIPNILGIYHFKPDRVVFCTTERMEAEKRTDAIIDALKLYGLDYSNTHERVQVDQDCLEDCESKFKNEIAQKEGEMGLNLKNTLYKEAKRSEVKMYNVGLTPIISDPNHLHGGVFWI